MTPRLLIVDDERTIRTILTRILTDEGYQVTSASTGEEALSILADVGPDLILLDQNMPGMNGTETMARVLAQSPDTTVIFLTAHGSISHAVDAMKHGAYDYLTKPFDNDELLLVIRRALEHKRLAGEVDSLRRELADKFRFENIIGASRPMLVLFEQMRRVCTTNATVLVQGDSGTGKELVAKALHYHSGRKGKPFISVNCGAIPVSLIESELFGHERGAFTDAKERKAGPFELADGGTLLLDEIGELPLDAQVKLLRILEDRTVTRLGGHTPIPVDVRIIAATNKKLENEVSAGRFRLDLLYRLNVFTLTVPPLKDRREDIPLLTEHFLTTYRTTLGIPVTSISRAAIDALVTYDWPGNVRDLENALQSAMILTSGEVVNYEDLPLRVKGYPDDAREAGGMGVLEEQVRAATSRLEKDMIQATLKANADNRTRTAEALGISRKTLFNKMREYGID